MNGNGTHATADATANGKRKRDDRVPDDRKSNSSTGGVKERRLRQRQEEMEEQFAATYLGPTKLYKLLEIQHMSSPLFLPRTLSYRLAPPASSTSTATVKTDAKVEVLDETKPITKPAKTTATIEPTAATLREFKIGMTAETIDHFKRESVRVGLLFAMYTASGRAFKDNSFELVATCLIPVPCVKEARLPKEFIRPQADIVAITVQVVKVTDVIDKLMAETQYVFKAPGKTEAKPVVGAQLLKAAVSGREPLFSNLLRIDGNRRRAGMYAMELPAVANSVRGAVKLQFRVVWDKPTKKAAMARLEKIANAKWGANYVETSMADISAELTVPKRIKESPWTRRESTPVFFHYLYHSLLRRMTEKRPDYSCAWCNMFAGSLKGLLSHLVSSHSRFRFHVASGPDRMIHVYVMPRNLKPDSSSSNVSPTACELNLDDDKDADRIEHHFSFISARKRAGRAGADAYEAEFDRALALSELEGHGDEQQQEFYTPLLQRQYFHSRTGAVVLDHEKDYDSDDDVDEEWITQQSERLLDEFEDVSLEEKEFMKKWNRHVKEHRILADFMVASSCRQFAKLHGKWLIESGLRYNFLLHLFNLWDNSLLNSRAIIDCILIVDHYAVLEETRAAAAATASS